MSRMMKQPGSGESLGRRPLHEDVANRLRDLILDGSLPEGELIPELELSARWNISRTPIREALKVLAVEGLVESQLRRGTIVSKLSNEQIHSMIVFLAELEGAAGALACRNAADAALTALERLHDRMERAYVSGNKSLYFKLNIEIHESIVELSGNDHLIATHKTFSDRLKKIRYVSNNLDRSWAKSVDDHRLMIKYLRERDCERLRQAAQAHVLAILPDT